MLRPLQCIVRRALSGATQVRKAERGPDGHARLLRLTGGVVACFGVVSVMQRSTQLARAIGAFGCAMADR
eukprot:9393548-Lingulodinium_polyedra.AAC.1